jgi:hypothetical protein
MIFNGCAAVNPPATNSLGDLPSKLGSDRNRELEASSPRALANFLPISSQSEAILAMLVLRFGLHSGLENVPVLLETVREWVSVCGESAS